MEIKQILNKYDIKLQEFASLLKISRPTLNNYINMYENNKVLPNPKYQHIFDGLFKREIDGKEEFSKVLTRYNRLLKRDESLGVKDFDIDSTNLLASITENIKKDISLAEYDEDIYKFINMLITSYRSDHVFKEYADYFLYLNGIKDVADIKDNEKPLVSNMFKVMSMIKDNKLETDEEYYALYIKRIAEIQKINQSKSKERTKEMETNLKKLLRKKIKEQVQEQLELGVDIDQINFDELIQRIDLNKINK